MEKNELYPIFLKVSELNTLIVGGGNVGLEKLTFLLKSSPNAKVTIVSKDFKQELIDLANLHQVELITDSYEPTYLQYRHMVIATTDNVEVNVQVYKDCKNRNILVNVADNPPYCDFYMGGIVTKGNVKLAISTNGKSPTTAKRLRQFFEEVIPEDINDLVQNLNIFRKTIKGDFEEKVTALNDLTKGLIEDKEK
jgi:precorrin-2 dehydrogenase/sirohydrochlorin ferrochelatase